jgi:Fic family protein
LKVIVLKEIALTLRNRFGDNEGLTISGKSMREHLEAINHKEAIDYIKFLIDKNSDISEREILNIHNLILRGIDPSNAGSTGQFK